MSKILTQSKIYKYLKNQNFNNFIPLISDDSDSYEIYPYIREFNVDKERKAIECERAVNDMLSAWYMSKYKGKFMDGTITSVTSFGMFVTLDNGIEGLVSLNNLIDYFDYDSYNMKYTNGHITYKLGDRVTVAIVKADKKSRKIDFMFKDDYLAMEEEYENSLY